MSEFSPVLVDLLPEADYDVLHVAVWALAKIASNQEDRVRRILLSRNKDLDAEQVSGLMRAFKEPKRGRS